MQYYQQHLQDRADVWEFIDGARALRAALCGTSALPARVAEFWAKTFRKRVLLRYGGTEFGMRLLCRWDG